MRGLTLLAMAALGCGGGGVPRDASRDLSSADDANDRDSSRADLEVGRERDSDRQPLDDDGGGDGGLDLSPTNEDGPPDVTPPHPVSTRCGDGIRDPVSEECDEGGEAASCTADCRVRAAAVPTRAGDADGGQEVGVTPQPSLGTSPHVGAGTDEGLAVVYGVPGAVPAVEVQLFGASGGPQGEPLDVAADFGPLPAANPTVAALPGGRFAVAWTDSMAGPPEVRVRVVDGRALGEARLAHDSVAGLHGDPDLLWTGDRLIVAYTDLLDVRYRAFDDQLVPLGPDAPLAATAAIESNVSLAPLGTGWAAAVRSNADGLETIAVVSGDLEWSTSPAPPGPPGDRPALVPLDDTHLLVVFTIGADPQGTGTSNVGRLRAAVAATATPGMLSSFAIDAGAAASAPGDDVSQRRPTAARIGAAAYVGWTNSTDGGFGSEQIFVSVASLDAAKPEGVGFSGAMALPRGIASPGLDRSLRLGSSSLFPAGALVSTWERTSDGSSLATVGIELDLRPSPFVFLP